MKTSSKLLLSFGVVGLLGAIAYVKLNKEFQKLMNYCYKVSSFKIRSLKNDNVTMEMNLLFKNNSNLSFTVSGYNIDVYVNDKMVTNVKSETNTLVTANSISEIKGIEISFSPKKVFILSDVIKLTSNLITSTKDVNMKFVGTISAKFGFLTFKNVPVDISYSVYELMQPSTEETCKI